MRDLIVQEERPGYGSYVELLLPDLRYDVARVLLEFMYTGRLSAPLSCTSPLLQDLAAAAEAYGVVQLKALCQNVASFRLQVTALAEGS
ncbi:unnamed protein product, partial [Chrysoparadoxa australica]